MAQLTVNNDPEEIRKYWGKIEDTIGDLQEQLKNTDNAIGIVNDGWKDDNFEQFKNNFNQDKEMIIPLCKALGQYVNLLQQLERKLRDYGDLDLHL